MKPELLESAICGEDRECVESLRGVREALLELNRASLKLSKLLRVNGLEKPLIKSVVNIGEARRELKEKFKVEDEELIDYAIRRALYMKLHGKVKASRDDMLCPLCGKPPTLIFFKKTDTGLFSGDIPHARCSCGMEWEYNEWRCPRCGVYGRTLFEVSVSTSTPIELRKCKRCGYTLFVARRIVGDKDYFHALASMVARGVEW